MSNRPMVMPPTGRELEADALDAVDEMRRLLGTEIAVAAIDELLEVAPLSDRVVVAQAIGQDSVEE